MSFQWLAWRPSPKVMLVENGAPAVAPPSIEKYLSRLSAVQSITPDAVLSAEKRNRSSDERKVKALAGNGPPFGGLLKSRKSTPLTKPSAWPISCAAMPTKS